MRERSAEQALVQGIRDLGGMALKIAPTTAGLPDRLLLLSGGRTVLVELKSETGSLSPIQTYWHGKAAAIGHRVIVLYGVVQVREFLAFLSGTTPGGTPEDDRVEDHAGSEEGQAGEQQVPLVGGGTEPADHEQHHSDDGEHGEPPTGTVPAVSLP